MIRQLALSTLSATLLTILPTTCRAITVPFTEHFDSSSANWANAAGDDVLVFNASGGPDGSGYASGTFNFEATAEDDGVTVLRATNTPGGDSSDGAFFGDWASGVSEFSYQIRHSAPVPVTFFTRFATPANFPAAIGLQFAPVPPDTWTEVTTEIDPSNPQLIFEGPPAFPTVFGNVGQIQIGATVPAALAGLDQEFTFDLDQVTAVPEPTAITLALLGAIGLWGGRRRRT